MLSEKLKAMKYSAIKSILLVDDDRDDIYFFSNALEKLESDIILLTAGDGEDAFERLKEYTPDVILLDLNMPKMNGVTFLKTIKKIKYLKDIPVIIYASALNVFDEERMIGLGAYAAYRKPEDLEQTLETIRQLLQLNFVRMVG